jgi:hypothetical protein
MAIDRTFLFRSAGGHTTTADLPGLVDAAPSAPAVYWPLVQALATMAVGRYTLDSGVARPSLPRPVTIPQAEIQSSEEAPLTLTVITAEEADAPLSTVAIYSNVSMQAASMPGALPFIAAVQATSVAAKAEAIVRDALVAAAGTAAADADAAIAATNAWPGAVLIATGATSGAADLLAAADSSGGAIKVVVDPALDSVNLAIRPAGIAFGVTSLEKVEGIEVVLAGTEMATYVHIQGPLVEPGAVASW